MTLLNASKSLGSPIMWVVFGMTSAYLWTQEGWSLWTWLIFAIAVIVLDTLVGGLLGRIQ